MRPRLLWCGVLAAVLYVAMTLGVGLAWPGYSVTSQTPSELSAIGAPTRWLWIVLGVVYAALMGAFGWEVRATAPRRRALRTVGALVMAQAVFGMMWPPMHQRSVLAAGGATLTDHLHLAWAFVSVVVFLVVIVAGATAFGTRFRAYSVITILVMLGSGARTGTYASAIQANLPTPGVGVWERVSIAAYMLWIAVLAFTLARRRAAAAAAPTIGAVPANGTPGPQVHGDVHPGFEPVRAAFAENLRRRHEVGGACSADRAGDRIVDLWGGRRDRQTGEPWEQDTMVVIHSATKGLAAMTLALAHSRRWLDYDERVATYWPEFAQKGKARITVRQLLAHQAGLFAIDEPVDRLTIADPDRLAAILARQTPAWEPGTRQAYHALTLGFYEGELLRRIDPRHRTLGRFFDEEIAAPLGLDLYLRLPDAIPNARLARLAPPAFWRMIVGFPPGFALQVMNPRSNIYRALAINPGTDVYLDRERIYARNLEVPSGNGVGTARAIARAYGVFASGGRELGLRQETLDLLAAPARRPAHGFFDECLRAEVRFSLGFMKPSVVWPFGGPRSFGAPGSGGALGFADPDAGIGYAYVTSQMGTTLAGDPRDVALRQALYAALPDVSGASPAAA